MRPDAATPSAIVIDLLARSEALARAASVAMDDGDDVQLSSLLDERDAVIGAIGSAWRAARPESLTPELLGQVAQAMRSTQAAGVQARAAAMRIRAQVVAELSALDARQHASQEYQVGQERATINVVL
jgi:hypothetical protein